jgi:hypothetical protein
MRKKTVSLILSCFLVLIFLFPYPTTSIPEWRVQVVDTLDNPMPNFKINQKWSNGGKENIETLTTNIDGVVVFPVRTTFRPLLFRIITGLLERINNIVMLHGSFVGPYAWVYSGDGARADMLLYSEGREIEHKLVLKDYP